MNVIVKSKDSSKCTMILKMEKFYEIVNHGLTPRQCIDIIMHYYDRNIRITLDASPEFKKMYNKRVIASN